MPATHGSKAKVFAYGFDLTSFLRRTNPQAMIDLDDVSVLGTQAKGYVAGLRDGRYSLEGFFFGGSNELDQILQANLGVVGDIISLANGDAIGGRAAGLEGKLQTYNIDSNVAGASTVTGDLQSDVGMDGLVNLKPFDSTVTNQTSVDELAGTTNGGVGYLQVASGASLVIKIEHSTDNSIFTTLITFAAASTRSTQRVTVAGTVNRYVRVGSITGTGTAYCGWSRK